MTEYCSRSSLGASYIQLCASSKLHLENHPWPLGVSWSSYPSSGSDKNILVSDVWQDFFYCVFPLLIKRIFSWVRVGEKRILCLLPWIFLRHKLQTRLWSETRTKLTFMDTILTNGIYYVQMRIHKISLLCALLLLRQNNQFRN